MNWINALLDLEEAFRDGMRGSSLDWGMIGRRLRGTEINSLAPSMVEECIMNAYERHRYSPVSKYSNLIKVISLEATCSLMRRFAPEEPDLYRALYGSLNELVHRSHRPYERSYDSSFKFDGLSTIAKEIEAASWAGSRDRHFEDELKKRKAFMMDPTIMEERELKHPASMDKDKLMAQLQSVQLKFEGQKQEKPKTEFLKAIEDIG